MTKQKVDVVGIAQKQRYAHLIEKMKSGTSLTKAEIEELAQFTADKSTALPDEADVKADQVLKTQRLAAEYADVNVRTLKRWVKAGMPTTSEGYYIRGILDFFKKSSGRAPNEDRQRFGKAEADLKETKAKLASIELRMKQGELLDSFEIESGRVARVIAVKRALVGLGRKLAPRVSKLGGTPSGIQKIIDLEIRQIITQFARD